MSQKMLPVMIRQTDDGDVPEVLAVFPTEPAGHGMVLCVSRHEGHGGCAPAYVRERTKPATKAQTEAMLGYLRARGYGHMKVVKRMSSAHQTERLRQARR